MCKIPLYFPLSGTVELSAERKKTDSQQLSVLTEGSTCQLRLFCWGFILQAKSRGEKNKQIRENYCVCTPCTNTSANITNLVQVKMELINMQIHLVKKRLQWWSLYYFIYKIYLFIFFSEMCHFGYIYTVKPKFIQTP